MATQILAYLLHTVACLLVLLRPLPWALFLVVISSGYALLGYSMQVCRSVAASKAASKSG